MSDDIYMTTEPGIISDEGEHDLLWFSYLHVNGTIITKRYLSWGDYIEAVNSDFVEQVTRIYEAPDVETARDISVELLEACI